MENIDYGGEIEAVLKNILFHQDKSPCPDTLSKEAIAAFGRRCAEAMREECAKANCMYCNDPAYAHIDTDMNHKSPHTIATFPCRSKAIRRVEVK